MIIYIYLIIFELLFDTLCFIPHSLILYVHKTNTLSFPRYPLIVYNLITYCVHIWITDVYIPTVCSFNNFLNKTYDNNKSLCRCCIWQIAQYKVKYLSPIHSQPFTDIILLYYSCDNLYKILLPIYILPPPTPSFVLPPHYINPSALSPLPGTV